MDITKINTIWRPVYGELMVGIQQLTPEWENLKQLRNFTQLSPRSINWPVELVNGGGIAFSSDGGSTARASSNEPPEATDSWTHMVGRFEVGFDELADEKLQAQAIEKQVRYQAADKLRSFKRAVGIGFYGYPNAHLFLAEGTASNPSGTATRVRLKDLYGVTGLAAKRVRDYLTVNKDYANVHAALASTVRGGGKVTAINETTLDIDLASASYFGAAVAAGDAVILNNQILAGASDDQDLGFNGLLHLTRATTVHNIASSSYADWAAGVDVSSYGSALQGADLYEWFEDISQRSGHEVSWAYTTVKAIAAAGGTELDQRRYGSDDETMRMGFKNLNIMGVQTEGRPYCPSGHFFMGSQTALRKIAPDEDVRDVIEAGDRAGGFKQYENTLGFYKDQVLRSQMACVSRLGLGVVSGVTEN